MEREECKERRKGETERQRVSDEERRVQIRKGMKEWKGRRDKERKGKIEKERKGGREIRRGREGER